MPTDSILGLFTDPSTYELQQLAQQRAMNERTAQLTPQQQVTANLLTAGYQLGQGVGGLMGAQDPQMRLMSARNAVLREIDQTNPESFAAGVRKLQQIGDIQGAYGLQELYQKRMESTAATSLKEAQALKASMAPKLTGDERYIAQLNFVENKLRQGKEPTDEDLSIANMAAQMLAKPRSFFDQASGQTVVLPATDPSKAFPLVFKKFGGEVTTAAAEIGRAHV